jgi:hypothetical protein
MKKHIYLLALPTFIFLLFSCSEEATEEMITTDELTNINIDKTYLFIDETANLLIYNIEDYPITQVTSVNPNITITKVNSLNYKISSSETGIELITITALDEKGNKLISSRRLNFYKHGTDDYNTVEGITIDSDSKSRVLSIHGEPEAKSSYTTTGENPTTYDNWYYFSKGFYFTIRQETDIVAGINIFPGLNPKRTIDNTPYTGSLYPYEIDGFNKPSATEGMLMDAIIEKYGEPDSKNASSNINSTLKRYVYEDLNNSVSGKQIAVFYFYSSDVNDYENKAVSYIIID